MKYYEKMLELGCVNKGIYQPQFVFDGAGLQRIQEHPMALWKCRSREQAIRMEPIRRNGTERKRTAAVLSMGNETEWVFPVRYNKIKEARVKDIQFKSKEVCHIRYAFFLAKKPGIQG